MSVRRFTMRREVRERLANRLLDRAEGGELHCPVCDCRLDKNSVLLLRNSEHFICPECSHDLACEAYRQEAYLEQPWLSVTAALADGKADPRCKSCPYLRAAAVACQQALSWIPEGSHKQRKMVSSMVRHPDRELPAPDCEATCPVIRHYRSEVGDRLLLL